VIKISLQQIINNPFAANLAFFSARNIPPGFGYPLYNSVK